MIEVELRGRLSKNSASRLLKFLRKNGTHLESHWREQIQLLDHPGYHSDPTKRRVDIRLRNTNGTCEIMVKLKMSAHNAGRREISLPLRDKNLHTATLIAKAFGCFRGLLMRRRKETYRYKGIEWSVVDAGKDIYFFEGERRVREKKYIKSAHQQIIKVVQSLNLKVFAPNQFHEFTKELARRVNKKVSW